MKESIAIINQKGGVGKSTTAHALGIGLATKKIRVLFVDLDAQGNLSYTLGLDSNKTTSYEVLTNEVTAAEAIQSGVMWDGLASSSALSGMDMNLTQTGKEYRLKEALEPIKDKYDYIIIDTPPALGILTVNALTACTGIIIPAQADIYSLQGIGQLYNTIDTVRRYCNPSLTIKGVLLTRYNPRSIISRDIAEMTAQTAERLKTQVYKTTIRESVSIKEAQAKQQDIYTYAPKSNPAADYKAFVKEFLS
jgi:chromosome partitioning protein